MIKKNILFVASTPAMSSYTTGLLTAVMLCNLINPYVIIFVDSNDIRTQKRVIEDYNLGNLPPKNIKILRHSASKLKLHLFQNLNVKIVKDFAVLNHVKSIHFITQDTFIAFKLYMLKDFKIYYTVHDLEPHDAKLTWLGNLKRYLLLTMKDKWNVNNINFLTTSSNHQFESLKRIYPNKNISQHNMPSLTTPSIKNGKTLVQELKDIKDYILFFGRIEAYKGIEYLYQTFIENVSLKNQTLVIAGSGKIYFKRELNKEKNIYFVNRYIKEEEFNDLFSNAKIVVFPYISATQSAVTSLPYFYKKPMIVSNVLGLKDTVIDKVTALFFDYNVANDLYCKLKLLLDDYALYNYIKENHTKNEKLFFAEDTLSKQIELIYT